MPVAFTLRRFAAACVVLTLLSALSFLLMRLAPGDAAVTIAGLGASPEYVEQIRRELSLDEPVYIQYVAWFSRVAQGEFGRSTATGRPVLEEVLPRLWATLVLGCFGTAIAVVLGVGIGIFTATRAGGLADLLGLIVVLAGVSTPSFVVALVLMLIFAVHLGWLPATGSGGFVYLILPALSLGLYHSALLARITRSVMTDVLKQDYVRTARAKGVPERTVVTWHALRNGLVVVVTVIGLELGRVLAGTVFVETVFAYPGLGTLLVDSIIARDMSVVQGALLVIGATYVLVNFLTDLSYGLIDPRVRSA